MYNTLKLYLERSVISFRTMSATTTKLSKQTPFIGTHDNTFHCDDVTACYMLKSLNRFKEHDIVRTRDPELLAKADIVVDVGGELDVDKLRLDHHQRSFNQTIKDYHPNIKTTNPNKAVRLSSAGLVYAIFGKDYIVEQLKSEKIFAGGDDDIEKKRMIDSIFDKFYIDVMEEIDAIDNGVEVVDGTDIIYNYHINSNLSNRVARFNHVKENATPEERLTQFRNAMDMVGKEISEELRFIASVWWPKQQELRDCILKRHEFDSSGQIVFCNVYPVSWKSVYDIEEELGIKGELKFIIFTDGSKASPWRATGVPVAHKSFKCRVPLKEEWRGIRDDELQKICGVPDATFVHMSGFTGGALSRDGIHNMVRKTLSLD